MILPSFFVELVHKIILFSSVEISIPCGTPLNWVVFVLVLVSWVYRTGLFLLACVLFRLTCELQILRFEGLRKLFEGCGSDANMIFREHVRIRRQLWIMSHRYKFFIITCLVTITISQLGSLLLVLESKSDTTFFNSGDLVIPLGAILAIVDPVVIGIVEKPEVIAVSKLIKSGLAVIAGK
ncbi:hypothetical protein JHK87_000707 [Glycine soja]|nr:hypothetical protein JHK87_000707 [Glycine soja]